MSDELSAYLNDHHAGSVAAIEMIDHMIDSYKSGPTAQFFSVLRAEIQEDQLELESIMKSAGVHVGALKQAAAWMTEKLTRLKLGVGRTEDHEMGLFLALEVLIVGITGKHALWTALAVASENVSTLKGFNYEHLQKRALEQRERVEVKRLEIARRTF